VAGSRQHVLPRFLLRGFQSRISGNQIYTWVQRKGRASFETNILNAFVEGKFYEAAEVNVDDDITNLENRFAPIIDGLRKETSSRTISNSEIPELVVHLSIRTKNLRDSFFAASNYVFKGLITYMEDPKNLHTMLCRAIKRRSRWWRELVDEKRKTSGLSRKQFEMFVPRLEEEVLSSTILPRAALIEVALIRQVFEENLERLMKDGHLKSLSKGLIPQPRLELYKKLNWHLIKLEKGSLILGDAGPIHQVGQEFKALPDGEDVIQSVYLPIGDSHVLTGTMLEAVPFVDPEVVNNGESTSAREVRHWIKSGCG